MSAQNREAERQRQLQTTEESGIPFPSDMAVAERQRQVQTTGNVAPARNLILIGFMGVGKSTVGRLCAAQLGLEFYDSDRHIEARAGISIRELFETQGEARFRQLEREMIAELAARPGLVIATGGGAPLDPDNAAALRASGLVVLLRAAPNMLLRRVGNARSRPLLADSANPCARIESLLAERDTRYRAAAHCHVDTTHLSVKQVAEAVVTLYEMTLPAL